MNHDKDQEFEEAIEDRAAEWFVRHREGELTPQEQRQFMQWLRVSPRHVEAYLSFIGLTTKLPEAIAELDVNAEALAEKVRQSGHPAEQALFTRRRPAPTPPGYPRLGLLAALWTVLIATGGIYWLTQMRAAGKSIAVPPGQQRVLTLSDGSVMHLDSNTRAIVHYSDSQRVVELSEGQGLFSVTHDARRPFIVRSGRLDVVALGTEFDVYHRSSRTQVTVVEGRIEILGDKSSNLPPSETSLRMSAGEQVRLDDATRSAQPVQVDVQLVTAWSHKKVSFSGERLEDVASRFSRYTGARIIIEDASLRDYRISGVFRAYDVDSFIAYLQALGGVVVDRRSSDQGDEIRVRGETVTKDSARMR